MKGYIRAVAMVQCDEVTRVGQRWGNDAVCDGWSQMQRKRYGSFTEVSGYMWPCMCVQRLLWSFAVR